MKRRTPRRRGSAVRISVSRAARLRRFVLLLSQGPCNRENTLQVLGIGLRTFYRELDFVRRCGIKVGRKGPTYSLLTSPEKADGRLPFPDPQLSFAETMELSRFPGAAAKRLAEMLSNVVRRVEPTPPGRRGRGGPGTSSSAERAEGGGAASVKTEPRPAHTSAR